MENSRREAACGHTFYANENGSIVLAKGLATRKSVSLKSEKLEVKTQMAGGNGMKSEGIKNRREQEEGKP
ncbi:hypothetical protein A6X21_12485 [Planctopirus hydrillae]|uniref:Uncharacterized protein n=1 Tax=Planctopirus hydrillae TaxID=1841610 RepID=A0A1C3E5U4_9PLAN|nr:hypothetical protein A6X21_12485 [Planctopirus hydrillae]